jgi:suppressor for copper-sensitivity B
MRRSQIFGRAIGFALIVTVWACVGRAAGPQTGRKLQLDDLLGKTRALPGLKDEAADEKPIVHVALTPSTAKVGNVVTLSVTVSLPADMYTYSMSPGGAGATHIDITDAVGLEPQADFEADRAPTVLMDPTTGKPFEKFERVVTWLRPYVVKTEKPESVRVSGTIDFKYCNSSNCRTFSQPIRARLVSDGSIEETSTAAAEAADGFSKVVTPANFGGQPAPVRLKFVLSPPDPKPGDKVTLAITMNLEAGWHTYSTTQKEGVGSTTTKVTLTKGRGLRPIGDAFQPDRAPELTAKGTDNLEPKEVYHGEVTWKRQFKFEPKAGEKGIGVAGKIHYGVCDEAKCLPPKSIDFSLGNVEAAGPLPKPLADDMQHEANAAYVSSEGSLWFYLATAFLGGIILNVMPCVLPVLAIKVLSFVQQAGESRSRIFLLNVAYTVGVLAVFLTLATLSVTLKIGWGGLFQQTRFNLVMACVVFAMGLSLLGVFEIPVPGLVGSAAGSNQKEGFLGAFLTGILATLLATPCTGPVMATAIGWSFGQPPVVVYLICGVMGLGMAAPYLLLGVFPQLVRWLPRPGNWMIRFKEFAGFVLLGSVIFIVSFTDKKYTIPLLVMLLGVALGLWMIGNLYDINSRIRHKMTVRLTALGLTALICWLGFGLTGENKHSLPWEPFSEARVAALLKEHKTVLIDFTAEWCINCHVNEFVALDTKETKELVVQNGIVPLKADFTNESAEIKRWLIKFKQAGVPLTVIFPGERQKTPIVLDGVYTKGTLLQKLKEAVRVPLPPNARTEPATVVR